MFQLLSLVGALLIFLLSVIVTLVTLGVWFVLLNEVRKAWGDDERMFLAAVKVILIGGLNSLIGFGAYTVTMSALSVLLGVS